MSVPDEERKHSPENYEVMAQAVGSAATEEAKKVFL
jgi:hypothetical protein